MLKNIKNLLCDLLYENGNLSITKFIAFYGYFIFTVITIYLIVTDQTWANYSEAAAYLAGSSTALIAGNKFVDSRYNTVQGGYGTVDGSRTNGKASLQDNINTVNTLLTKIDKQYTDITKDAEKLNDALTNAPDINNKTQSFKDKFFKKK